MNSVYAEIMDAIVYVNVFESIISIFYCNRWILFINEAIYLDEVGYVRNFHLNFCVIFFNQS